MSERPLTDKQTMLLILEDVIRSRTPAELEEWLKHGAKISGVPLQVGRMRMKYRKPMFDSVMVHAKLHFFAMQTSSMVAMKQHGTFSKIAKVLEEALDEHLTKNCQEGLVCLYYSLLDSAIFHTVADDWEMAHYSQQDEADFEIMLAKEKKKRILEDLQAPPASQMH